MATTFDVIHLGVLADIDTTEGDLDAENAGGLVGLTLGSNGDPLYDHIQSFSPGTTGFGAGGAGSYDPDTTTDTFSIDGGSDQTFDMAMLYNATITYADGSSDTTTVILAQDDVGNTYVVPWTSNNSNQAVLEAAPIESITLGSNVPGANNGYGLTADRYAGDFAGPVDGISGAENMGVGYTDADSDQITTGNDIIYGNGGDDTINGGDGRDTISGGDGDDALVFDDIDSGHEPPSGGSWDDYNGTPDAINTDTSGAQSPPQIISLDDGRTMYVWIDSATSTTSSAMEIQARIFDTDGTPATGQIDLGALDAVSGLQTFDWDTLSLDLLDDGNVLISYAQNGADAGTGNIAPVFAIVEPTDTSINIVQGTTDVAQNDLTAIQGPPVTTVLDNGNVLFVWSENGSSDDSPTMVLNARTFDSDGNPVSNDFQIGTWAVDGYGSFDVPSLTVTQLEGGNVVVAYGRNTTAESGDYDEAIFTILDEDGNTVVADVEMQDTDSTTYEGPPVITAMADGNFMAVWIPNGYIDNSATMDLEGRIFDANGTPLTGDITITGSAFAVDGNDSYDIPTFTIDQLDSDHIVISYVNSSVTTSVGVGDQPHYSILDVSDPANPVFVVQDVPMSAGSSTSDLGPALIEPLGDSGYFVGVYGDGNGLSTGYGLNYRIFDVNGNPMTGDMQLTANDGSGDSVSGTNSFDWSSIDVEYNTVEGDFTVAWVGNSDGSGTGVYTSGPIDVSFLTGDGLSPEVANAGEGGETDGDFLDLGASTEDLTVTFSDTEDGNAVENATNEELLFSEIERLATGSGDDLIDGSAATGNLEIDAGAGSDSVIGGSGDETLVAGLGSDTLRGGDGDDLLIRDGTDVNDILNVLDGGAGNDTIRIEDGVNANDQIDGGEGIDNLELLPGDDRNFTIDMIGGAAHDGTIGTLEFSNIENITAGGGDDTIIGDTGDNILSGGDGDDTIDGGAGADTLIGGDGADVFIADGTADVITDFDATTGVNGGGGGDNDFVDLTAYYNETTLAAWNTANPGQTYDLALGWLRADQADGILDQAGGLQLQDEGSAVAGGELFAENTGVVCFVKGTLIATDQGEVTIEDLKPGDLVQTMDNGYQPLRWVGQRYLDANELEKNPNLRPIRISPLAVGLDLLNPDLIVSPQHRLLVASKVARRMFKSDEVLVSAKKLLTMEGVAVVKDIDSVFYYHILFDNHEIIFANGSAAESLYLGQEALKSLSPEGREEIHALFPETRAPEFVAKNCRPIVSGGKATKIASRLSKNKKTLVEWDGSVAHTCPASAAN